LEITQLQLVLAVVLELKEAIQFSDQSLHQAVDEEITITEN